jgi:YlmC/YmxH family sporulation protein
MDISFNEIRDKEVINLMDGSRMGHIIDVLFSGELGVVSGFVVPGEKRIFKKSDDIFIPLEKVRRMGDDVILVRVDVNDFYRDKLHSQKTGKNKIRYESNSVKFKNKDGSYIRYRKLDNKKYK